MGAPPADDDGAWIRRRRSPPNVSTRTCNKRQIEFERVHRILGAGTTVPQPTSEAFPVEDGGAKLSSSPRKY